MANYKVPKRFRIEKGKLGGKLHPNFQKIPSHHRKGPLKSTKYAVPKLPEADPSADTLWQREPLTAYTEAKEMWYKGIGLDAIREKTGIPIPEIKSWIHGYYRKEEDGTVKWLTKGLPHNPWIKERAEKEEKLLKEVYRDIKDQLEDNIQKTLTVIQKGVQLIDAHNHELTPTEIAALTRTLESLHTVESLEAVTTTRREGTKGAKLTRLEILEILRKADPMISYEEEKNVDSIETSSGG